MAGMYREKIQPTNEKTGRLLPAVWRIHGHSINSMRSNASIVPMTLTSPSYQSGLLLLPDAPDLQSQGLITD